MCTNTSLYLRVPLAVTALLAGPPCRSRISEVDGSDPPFLPPRSARQGVLMCTSVSHPWRVAPVPKIPCGKTRNDTRDRQDGTHERPGHPRGATEDPQKGGPWSGFEDDTPIAACTVAIGADGLGHRLSRRRTRGVVPISDVTARLCSGALPTDGSCPCGFVIL